MSSIGPELVRFAAASGVVLRDRDRRCCGVMAGDVNRAAPCLLENWQRSEIRREYPEWSDAQVARELFRLTLLPALVPARLR